MSSTSREATPSGAVGGARNPESRVAGAGGERRWTIYVCDNCNRVHSHAGACRHWAEHESGGACYSVEVVEVAALEQAQEALEAFVQGYEWAHNDAVFAAPEDMDRRRRQWEVLGDRAQKARKVLAALASGGVSAPPVQPEGNEGGSP